MDELIEVLISPEDADLIEYGWSISNGYILTNVHDESTGYSKSVSLHKIILERKLGRKLESHEQVDHIDRNKLNNCRDNLRSSTKSENSRNSKIYFNNTSGFRGVYKNHQKWMAQITVDRKSVYIGTFDTKEEAIKAHLDKYYETHHEYPPEIVTENSPLH